MYVLQVVSGNGVKQGTKRVRSPADSDDDDPFVGSDSSPPKPKRARPDSPRAKPAAPAPPRGSSLSQLASRQPFAQAPEPVYDEPSVEELWAQLEGREHELNLYKKTVFDLRAEREQLLKRIEFDHGKIQALSQEAQLQQQVLVNFRHAMDGLQAQLQKQQAKAAEDALSAQRENRQLSAKAKGLEARMNRDIASDLTSNPGLLNVSSGFATPADVKARYSRLMTEDRADLRCRGCAAKRGTRPQ